MKNIKLFIIVALSTIILIYSINNVANSCKDGEHIEYITNSFGVKEFRCIR